MIGILRKLLVHSLFQASASILPFFFVFFFLFVLSFSYNLIGLKEMLVLNIFKEKKYDKNKLLLEIIRLRNELFTKKVK